MFLVLIHFPLLSSPSPGPSVAIDTACSSSLLALENAFHAIRQGQCDAALVGGVNLLLKPNTSVQFMKLGMLSPEGTCKSFDSSGKTKLHGTHLALWFQMSTMISNVPQSNPAEALCCISLFLVSCQLFTISSYLIQA